MSEPPLTRVRVRGHGGRELIVHRLRPKGEPCASALILHGIQSHAGWYESTARALAADGIDVALPERRGSGVDRRERGHAPSATALAEDVFAVSRRLAEESGKVPAWVGVSWGGKLALSLARARPSALARLALVVPGIWPRIGLSRSEILRVALLLLKGGRDRVPIPLEDPALFSHDPQWQAFVAGDPLALRSASAQFLLASRRLDRRAQALSPRLDPGLELLLVLAGDDAIIDNQATLWHLAFIAGEQLRVVTLAGVRHTPEQSPMAASYQARLSAFIRGMACTNLQVS